MKHELLFDLNLSGVSAVLLKKNGNTPEVVAVSEEKIDLPERLSLPDIYRKSKPAVIRLASASLKLFKEKGIRIGNVKFIFSLPFPYYLSRLQTVKVVRKKEFSVNAQFLNAILDEETLAFKKKIETAKNPGTDEIEILEKEIIFSLLNGYPVKNFIDKRCLSMELGVFLSAAPKKIILDIEEELSRCFGNIKIFFKTRLYAAFKAAKTLFGGEESFIFLNIGDETSDIFLLKDRALKESVSFAKGENFFSRRIAFDLNRPEKEGEAFLSAFNEGRLAPEISEKTEKILVPALNEWSGALKKAFSAILAENLLPAVLKANVPKTIRRSVAKILANEDLKSYTVLGRPFKTDFLDEEHLTGRLAIDPVLKSRLLKNPELALLIIADLE